MKNRKIYPVIGYNYHAKKNNAILVFFGYFIGYLLAGIVIEHYFNLKGVQLSWSEIADAWWFFLIVSVVLATITTIAWINKDDGNK